MFANTLTMLFKRLNPFNHCPHFRFFMTHFTDSMPISSIGCIWSADLWNPKYASHVLQGDRCRSANFWIQAPFGYH